MSIDEEAKVLQGVPPFAPLDVRKLKLLALASERLVYDSGETLIKQDEDSDAVFVVIDGLIDISIASGEGSSHILELGQYAFVGEIGVIKSRPRAATVTAKTDVVALKISKDVLFKLMKEVPSLRNRIASHMEKWDYLHE